jgi:hypothetical protein
MQPSELATTIQRLHLSASRTDGLDRECTREMFSLMLVQTGKVSEQDIREICCLSAIRCQ